MQGLVLDELLGEGGTACVHAARWHGTDVCAKVSREATDAAVGVLLAEAATMARLAHPALPRVLAAGRLADGRACLVMPRLHGEDLAARRRRGVLALDEVIAIAEDVGGALTAMHEHGLLHRDVKPENIFLATSGPMLIDLGLARDLDSSTVSAQPRGTHEHVAPERLFGEPATIASEVYELATVVWMMIAGRLPWPVGAGPAARRDLPALPGDRERALDAVLRRALSTRPDRRHATIAELVAELRVAAAAGTAVAARHTQPLGPPCEQPAPVAPGVGTVLADTYRLTRVIGKGSSGHVFEAEHLRVPVRFAIKVLRADCEDGEPRARFRREAEIIAALDHPRIVKVFDYDVDTDGVPYMVMGLVAGETLRERLRRGPLQPADVVTLVEQIADAIEVAHRAGVVHRDLKPSNVLLRESDGAVDAVVLDFGISKLVGGDLDVTTTGTQLGTPGYAPPEQVCGDAVEPAADVFALAAIAYEALAGQRAFAAPTRDAVLYQICHGEPQLAGVSRDVARVIRIGLAKHAARRWSSPRALAAALRAALERGVQPRRAFARTAAGAVAIASAAAVAMLLAPARHAASAQDLAPARHAASARDAAPPAPAARVIEASPVVAAESPAVRPPPASPATASPPVARPRAPSRAGRDRTPREPTTRPVPASLRTLLEQ